MRYSRWSLCIRVTLRRSSVRCIDVRATGLSGYDFMRGLFEAERVSVLDGGAFGEETRGFVRLCFATDEATLHKAILRIRRYAGTLAR